MKNSVQNEILMILNKIGSHELKIGLNIEYPEKKLTYERR